MKLSLTGCFKWKCRAAPLDFQKPLWGPSDVAQSVIKVNIIITLDILQYLAIEICALLEFHAA